MRAAAVSLLFLAPALRAFSPAIAEGDGLRIEIPGQPPWTQLEAPREVPVLLANRSAVPLRGTVRIGLTDDWRVDGEDEQPFELAPGAAAQANFAIVAGRGTYAAHYPIHATAEFEAGGDAVSLHAVLVVEAQPPVTALGRAADRTLTALRGAVRVDGELSEWADAAPVDLGLADATLGAPEATDFSARAMLLWDNTALYLAVQATDDRLDGSDTASRDLVDSDYVRLTLSPLAPAGRTDGLLGADDLVLAIAPGAELVKLVTYEGAGRAAFEVAAVTLAVGTDAAGWRLEAAIPWTALGRTPAAGDTWAANLQLGDSDGAGRRAELCLGGTRGEYWKDPRQMVPLRFSAATRDESGAALPLTQVPARGRLALARLRPGRVVIDRFDGESYPLAYGAVNDEATRANWSPSTTATRGESRLAIGFHPPWSGGLKGTVAGDYRLALPETTPLTLTVGLAIRDQGADEPPSDGVTFRVLAAPEGGEFASLFERHTAAKAWDEVEVDLSAYAGQVITLRLLGDPGPDRDTTCDSAFWGGPVLRAGPEPPSESEAERAERASQARQAARAALAGRGPSSSWRVEGEAGTVGIAVIPGPRGLLDAQIALAGEGGELLFDGFAAEVDGAPLGELLDGEDSVRSAATERRPDAPLEVQHRFRSGEQAGVALARVEATAQGLRIAWSMPGVERTPRGEPWFTRLGLGPCDAEPFRVYFGHGHVLQGTPRFSLGYGGFTLSTRYAGVEYAGNLALVTACDPIPDRLEHDQARRHTALVASGDVTFDLIASTGGAFAGARAWRLLADLPAGPGVADIRGKMCIDQWGGDYGQAARDLELATAYGLDQAVFVKHVWQRWGYDYRLPDIYPPAGDRADFDAMAAAAKLNGRLFALHDNYIDFYPDAEGFTYDAIEFRRDGQPQRAWLNEGRDAQSYRWLPTTFWPYLERNLRLVEDNLDPSSYFIDVFSAMAPHDCYDRAGRFITKTVETEWWARSFDRTREVIGGPTISEAGHDALIGHLDAAQADHLTVDPQGGQFNLAQPYEQWDRVPWFDMGHHGKFVLFAGGLGSRYAGGRPAALHGYGSDDYLSLTVLGGRTPMCDGPFGRATVMTYWLLQPICAELERQEMLAHAFVGDSVRRQRVSWSDGEVTVNRGPEDLSVGGVTMPEYGFVARAGELRADITRREGVISAFSSAPGVIFADARPPDRYAPRRAAIAAEVTDFERVGARGFRLALRVRVDRPGPAGHQLFVHLCGPAAMLPDWQANSDILFQAGSDWRPEFATQVGERTVTIAGELPAALLPGELAIKFGLYHPQSGSRLPLRAPAFDDARHDGGRLVVEGTGAATGLTWQSAGAPGSLPRTNAERRVLDFGPVATNSAVRLLHGEGAWRLLMLPGSAPATVLLRLDQLGAAGRRPAAVEQLETDGSVVGPASYRQEGDRLTIETGDQAFGYRIVW